MLSLKTIKILKGLGIGAGLITLGASIGVGYYFSDLKNPYHEFFKRPVADGPNALNQAYFAAKEGGAKIIVGTGFIHDPAIKTLSSNPSFDEVGFLGVDVTYTGNHPENVATVNFKTEQSGFLTGIATGMYLNDNKSFFEKIGSDGEKYLSYAIWGGIPSTPVNSYLAGFQQGITYFNNNIVDKDASLQKVYMSVQQNIYSYGFAPNDGNSIIDELIYKGGYLFEVNGENSKLVNEKVIKVAPSAIFPVAGPQTAVAVSRILSDNKKIAVIGVDTAMEDDPNTTKSYGPSIPTNELPKINGKTTSIIPFSAIKDMSNSTKKILENMYENRTDHENGIGGFGFSSIGDLSNGGAGISNNGYIPLIKAMSKLNTPGPNTFDLNNGDELLKSYERIKNYFINEINKNPQFLKPKVIFSKPKNLNPTSALHFEIDPDNVGSYEPLKSANWLTTGNDLPKKAIDFTKLMSSELQNNLKNDKSKFRNAIKIVLSTPTSVLFDHSFAEAGYQGIYDFYLDKEKIPVPPSSNK